MNSTGRSGNISRVIFLVWQLVLSAAGGAAIGRFLHGLLRMVGLAIDGEHAETIGYFISFALFLVFFECVVCRPERVSSRRIADLEAANKRLSDKLEAAKEDIAFFKSQQKGRE